MKEIILTMCILASSFLSLNAETINNTSTVAKKTFELFDFSKIKLEGDMSMLLSKEASIRPKKGMLFINRTKLPIAKASKDGVLIGDDYKGEQKTIFIETDEMYATGDKRCS